MHHTGMVLLGTLSILLCGGNIAAASSDTVSSTVTINVNAGGSIIPEATLGCHYSPLDHQLYYIYSQLIYDESFEQSLAGTEKEGVGDNISLGWTNLSHAAGAGSITWASTPADAFNGNASVVLESIPQYTTGNTLYPPTPPHPTSSAHTSAAATTSAATTRRIGVANRGLYHQGFALEGGKQYRGYLAVKSNRSASVTVALEDWDVNPSEPPQPPLQTASAAASNSNYTVAQTMVHHSGDGKWTVLPFTLTPSRSTTCKPFPYGTPPLNCGIPNSQSKFPPSESAECVVCGGTLTVSITNGDGNGNITSAGGDTATAYTKVAIDQVFLEPGEWGLYKGLHMHRTPVEWIERMGTKMLRYGGTFTQTVQGAWKSQRGQ